METVDNEIDTVRDENKNIESMLNELKEDLEIKRELRKSNNENYWKIKIECVENA